MIVEDEHALAVALEVAVRQAGAKGELAATAARARALLSAAGTGGYDAMLLDIGLPDENGLEFLSGLPDSQRPPTIVITAHGEIENSIAARQLGVVDFLPKPVDFDAFQNILRRLLQASADRAVDDGAANLTFIGAAAAMRPVFQQVAQACAAAEPVLVRGETGTGKTHVARLIQRNSGRSGEDRTLAAGPATTAGDLAAAVDAARGGTLVIEEVALLGAEAQAELLGRMEGDGEFPRLITTTGEDLRELAAAGSFRSDLFYRLQVLEVRLPPLRERMEDLPALVAHFTGRLKPGQAVDLTDRAVAKLQAHEWPGNLRELANAVAYALAASGGMIAPDVDDLPPYLDGEPPGEDRAEDELIRALDAWVEVRLGTPADYRAISEALEAHLIRRLLRRYDGKLARLARALGANRTTLRRRLGR